MMVIFDPYPGKGGNPFADVGVPTKVNGTWKDW